MPKKPRPDHLRVAIDSGQTGSKVSFPDPAAAPLGTDEEAAGTPVDLDDVAWAAEKEIRKPAESGERRDAPQGSFWMMVLAGAAVIVVAAYFLTK